MTVRIRTCEDFSVHPSQLSRLKALSRDIDALRGRIVTIVGGPRTPECRVAAFGAWLEGARASPVGVIMANPVGWFEVTGPDAAALQRFYADAFGWNIDASNPMNYGMVAAEEGGIGGGVGPHPEGKNHATFYIAVPDLDAALTKVAELGGQTIMPPMDVPDGPSIAFFSDPAGNQIGLMKGM